MASLDLGKQVGPLPLGAWIVVVGGGLGIAYYTRRSGQEPVIVDDTSGVPGVGTGAVGGWVPTSPTPQDPVQPAITTNEEWGRAAINWLLARGYPPNESDSAIRKYLAGTRTSIQEYTLIGLVLVALGSPPQPLPPTEDDPVTPPITPPTTPQTPAARTFVAPIPMSTRQAALAVYGPLGGLWNANGARFYWANEGVIVSTARSRGYTNNNAMNDATMPAGFVWSIP